MKLLERMSALMAAAALCVLPVFADAIAPPVPSRQSAPFLILAVIVVALCLLLRTMKRRRGGEGKQQEKKEEEKNHETPDE